MERGDKFFTVKIGTKEQVVLVDRLKPVFGFADPAPANPSPQLGQEDCYENLSSKERGDAGPYRGSVCPGCKVQSRENYQASSETGFLNVKDNCV